MKRALLGVLASCAVDGAIAADSIGSTADATAGGNATTRSTADAGVGTTASAPVDAAAHADYSFCTVCHGAHGNGNRAINAPKIAGMEPWYLKRQLEQFRAGRRGTQPTDVPGLEMQPVGLQLDDPAIEAVAAYVGTFEPQRPPVTVRADAARGRALYASCGGCHGARGEGNAALKAPALAGQTDWYLVTQLERFRAGERGFAPEDELGSQMRAAAAVLPDPAAINDVVAFINTLTARRHGI